MRVCIVLPHFLPHVGGGEQGFYDLAKGLLEMGHNVRVVCSSSGGIRGKHLYKEIDVYYYDWKMLCGHPLVRSKDLIKHVRWADIIHTSIYTTATKTRMLSEKMNKPCVITIHEVLGKKWFWIGLPCYKAAAFALYERFICIQRFRAYHFVSDATRKDYEKYFGKRSRAVRVHSCVHVSPVQEIIREQISLKEYFKLQGDELCFLYFGRPAPNKGIFILEDAVRILKERGMLYNIRFCWILSKEPEQQRKKLVKKIKKDGLDPWIKIMPSVERNALFKLIQEADYVIVPSITEGFGLCAAETCSLKKKIIYSSAGALPEVVWGECLQFQNRNPADLADKIQKVIECEEQAFQKIPEKHYNKKEMVEGILKIYEKVLSIDKK